MTFNNIETDWFLAQIKPNSYKIAKMNLKRQGFKTFLPMINETKRCNQKFVKVYDNFFSVSPEEAEKIKPICGKMRCPDCKGSGYYLVKRL